MAKDTFLVKNKEASDEILSECFRANKDTLRFGANVKTTKELIDLFADVPHTTDWDDINWHAGYYQGLQMARSHYFLPKE